MRGTKIGKEGPVLAAKISSAGPILKAKVVRGYQFWHNFLQNWSGWADFGVTGPSKLMRAGIGNNYTNDGLTSIELGLDDYSS